ncbi:MAG: choice-of-anchor I family protein [Alphaproteobacteria bacterium]|nr:choice-of-anchor I family protein [Alphaproteobacteria bacterium]
MRFGLFLGAALIGLALTPAAAQSPARPEVGLQFLARHAHGAFNKSASEISAYDARSRRLFVVNGDNGSIDILDIRDPRAPRAVGRLDLKPYGAAANSVAVHNGIVAVAVEATVRTDPGKAVFFSAQGQFLAAVTVGALPDMIAFSPDGRWVLTANEGEPNPEYTIDPEGSVSVIDLSQGVRGLTQRAVRTADFRSFRELPAGMRLAKPGATIAQDLEPEYITFSGDGRTAVVTLQENNGLAFIDLDTATVRRLVGLGLKDHSLHGLDASDRGDRARIQTWPVFGMYQPDAIASYQAEGRTFYITANEGDARDYRGFSEEVRVADLKLDPRAYPNAAELQRPENLGRLRTTSITGLNAAGLVERIHVFGARSFSIWDDQGTLVWDTGEEFERILLERLPQQFNADHARPGPRQRSDDKGPEPEAVTVWSDGGRTYAFIGLERIGGIMIYDVTNPRSPRFIDYATTRRFEGNHERGEAGDLGPEGVLVIRAADSPTGRPLLVVTNEVSGTTALFEITRR